MRVILDANIWISYLLSPRGDGTIPTLVQACIKPPIRLIVPRELMRELEGAYQKSPYLQDRVSEENFQRLLLLLPQVGQIPPALTGFASVVRDPKDDYLLAYGLIAQADFLVTGDKDLLAVGQVDSLTIIGPSEFLMLLYAEGLIAS